VDAGAVELRSYTSSAGAYGRKLSSWYIDGSIFNYVNCTSGRK
jgi:hypothetical protein